MISTLAVLGAYLAGSVPFGLFVTRLVSGRDVRTVGSGNIGATNVARAAGPAAALSTLLLDGAKGFVPAYFATKSADSTVLGAACGVAAVVGHCFPVWLGFRGGKGVATGLGVAL
ncbi:MAG: glycerol-3-phosphate acyltransferase, partial [Myxococcales bacterium]